ncbi:MAG: helix-turn-helix domain-containing protein [Oscillospiraceae bacterium]|jgi:DNA-binding XRE family transcriptional regulator|nr:helix-turn-helix domain-containing protein [Oscillospiraceae bacterium]
MKGLSGLKDFRNQIGYSQEGMARHIGVSLSQYEKIEQGRANPSYSFIRKLKEKFPDASADNIFFSQATA